MTPPPPTTGPAAPSQEKPGGLDWKEWFLIVGLLILGLGIAGFLVGVIPSLLVKDEGYQCSTVTADSNPRCVKRSGMVVDQQALDAARASTRAPFGLLSGAVLAGSAAAIGVVVSNHNARLTKEANALTKDRDRQSAQDAKETAENARKTFEEQSGRNREASEQARRVFQDQHERDRGASERERERATADRYTAAIEQLGHASASVRLGAMYSLHRLAGDDGDRLATIVDVLCAYLRQPFHHPDHDWDPDDEHTSEAKKPSRAWWPTGHKERDERDSEREVRATATHLIPTLLPTINTTDESSDTPQLLNINLRGAMLDTLNVSGRCMRNLSLDGTYIDGDLVLDDGTHIAGDLRLGKNAHITGNLVLGEDARITGDLVLGEDARINGDLRLGKNAHITGNLELDKDAHIAGDLVLGEDACINGDLWLREDAHIAGNLVLDKGAHITGDLRLDEGAYITGDLLLREDARIDGDLWLRADAHITGNLNLDKDAHITGDLEVDERAYVGGGFNDYFERITV